MSRDPEETGGVSKSEEYNDFEEEAMNANMGEGKQFLSYIPDAAAKRLLENSGILA